MLILWFLCTGIINAQNIYTGDMEGNKTELISNSYYKMQVQHALSSFKLEPQQTERGMFFQLHTEGYARSYDIGRAQLPTKNKLIELPHGADVEVNILHYDYQDFDLTAMGYAYPIIPAQPSYSKSTDASDIVFKYDKNYYGADFFFQEPLVEVVPSGILRGVRIGHLKIAPFAYNPSRNTLRVYNNISFEVTYTNPQISKTIELKERFYSPMFEAVHARLFNYQSLPNKGYLSTYPIKYIIVSDPMFENTLEPFVEWKTKKGFYVIEAYTNNPQVGTTTTSIKNYLDSIYNAASVGDPAPTYVLFVGDVAQIPSFSGTTGNHVTDLYYCEYHGGGNYFPDVYYGRFSANTISELRPQVEKTLLYEQYLMAGDAFLDTVVLVAGVDSYWATVHGNGQINYAVDNYFNQNQGIHAHTYFYPASASAGPQIRDDIYAGAGLANYTAHCLANGWSDPSFNVSHIPNMAEGKFGLVISNCCLPNKFNDPECFGEALLRANNKGAIGHVGASNNTYWDEDYWWSVGYTSNIVQHPTYQDTDLGAYDRLFHLHGEPENEWFVANGQIQFAGNLAVEASNSSRKHYYWEVYHLMGDPSLMTYLYKPLPLNANYLNPIVVGDDNLIINTEPYAYAAISHNNILLDAARADSNGLVVLNFAPFLTPDTAAIVITKQNHIPYTGLLHIIELQHQNDVAPVHIVEPLNQYNCSGVAIQPRVVIRNFGLDTLSSFDIHYQLNNSSIQSTSWAGQLASLETDTLILAPFMLSAGNHNLKVFTALPNHVADENPANDTVFKSFDVLDLPVEALFTISDSVFCNVPATVNFSNQSVNAQSYLWDFGDGTTSTATSPTHTYQNMGAYNVVLWADAGICGSDTLLLPYTINVGLAAPTAANVQNCGPDSVILTASGYDSIYWYSNTSDTIPLHIGDSLITPHLDTTTTYYAQGVISHPTQNAGRYDNAGSGGYFGSQTHWHYLIFDCYVPTTLKSVKVYADGSGTRTISLRDHSNQVLESVDVFIPHGESRITLNFDIPVANDLQLVGEGVVNLYRNTSITTYPYEIPGLISITESSASLSPYNTPGNYYYFYDWEVREQDCYSVFAPVTAYILDEPISDFSYQVSGYTVNFTDESIYAINHLWHFGDGNTSLLSNPIHTYALPGSYDVKLIAENACGTDSTEQSLFLQGLAPEVHFTASATAITVGDTVQFTDVSLFHPHTWNWIFEGGTPTTSQVQNPEVVYNNPGIFYVTLIADNDFGSSYLHKSQYIFVNTTSISPEEDRNFEVVLYPNPANNNKLYISFTTGATDFSVVIWNIYGAKIKSQIYKNSISPVSIDMSNVSSGAYLLQLQTKKHTKTLRFVVP